MLTDIGALADVFKKNINLRFNRHQKIRETSLAKQGLFKTQMRRITSRTRTLKGLFANLADYITGGVSASSVF